MNFLIHLPLAFHSNISIRKSISCHIEKNELLNSDVDKINIYEMSKEEVSRKNSDLASGS